MRRSKKFAFPILVYFLAMSLLVTACSTKGDSSDQAGEGNTTVTMWHGLTSIDLDNLNKVVKAFEEKNPTIKMKLVYTESSEGSDQKLLTAVAGGNPPDVALFDRFKVGTWAAQDSLTDLSSMAAESGIRKEMYYPFAWEESSYQGKLYAMPMDTDSRLLFYNKDHFKEVGLDPNKPPQTIAELEAAAEKLTIKEGKRFKRIGFIPWYSQGWLYTWGWAFGGEFQDAATGKITANDPKVVEALQWMADFGKKYNVEDIAGFTSAAGTEEMDPFISGQVSMKISGNFTVKGIEKFKPDLNYGVAPIPTPTGTNFTTWSGGGSAIIPKGAKNVAAAWKFLEFLGKEEGQTLLNADSQISVIDSVNDKYGYKDDPIMKEFINILPNSHNRPVIPEGQLLWNELASATEKATRGNGTPKENLDRVTETINKALEKYDK
ncbi:MULTISPECIES: ABC transporter substrate-binding protein [unclassified Paenibacillus]|uniref:ABC transporter substrate-binding protein n=1 Tax=unclassified Paenibacillus TaxID=185978 RepID=UPI0009A74D4C|nr:MULTISPECIES: ABC transporter substrate-binding protein [unclassified Paenibacillus]SLK04501.1 carbohydrate ABC transporter substrate-binding protein, CUT1 family [Paenibacillus sp. RU5A]SOC69749.1 carbohydrate ABC transporter substrate-binding protein, CUT1 family [Paenibacillus sp. RU26A]SOC72105.1 carbohydrate ABC transporter substrate-binding protein, CUT1 family [Paenibacillus sp. RU5M]